MSKDKRFVVRETQGNEFTTKYGILVDSVTGVNYLFIKDGYGAGLTPLLDAEGHVVVTKINEL